MMSVNPSPLMSAAATRTPPPNTGGKAVEGVTRASSSKASQLERGRGERLGRRSRRRGRRPGRMRQDSNRANQRDQGVDMATPGQGGLWTRRRLELALFKMNDLGRQVNWIYVK